MHHLKKSYLALLICTLPSNYAMEDVPEYINICTLLSLGVIGAKILSATYNRHKTETEFPNAVMQAARNDFPAKDVDDIKKYLDKDKDVDPNCKIGPHEQTIIMLAIQHSNKDLLKYLLQKKNIKVNISDNRGWTPLHYAIELQNDPTKSAKKYVRKLLKYNADSNEKTIWAETPFLFAIHQGYTNLVKFLIKYNADINYKYEYGTSLAYALKKHVPLKTIEALCKANTTLINVDNNKNSAFHVAINKECSKEYIQALIKYVNFNSNEIIQQTDEQFKKTIIETLLVLKERKIEPYLQFHILSRIALLNKFCNFNKKFCGYLFNMGYKKPFIFYINNQIYDTIKLLQVKNDENKTALDLLNAIQNLQYIQEVKPLIDADELQNNLNAFNATALNNKLILDDKNVIPQIFGFKLN